MDNLHQIIRTLSEKEKQAFLRFLLRHKSRRKRKDIELFKLLDRTTIPKKGKIKELLYGKASSGQAYHALRKRLMDQLTDFILLKNKEGDQSSASALMGWLSLARYLFERQQNELGWKMLYKAEQVGLQHEQFDLLRTVYQMQIEFAERNDDAHIAQILEKHENNKRKADEDERASIATSIIKIKLKDSRLRGKGINFDQTIKEVLQTYQLTESLQQRPKLFTQLMIIARSAVLAGKDYHAFEPFLLTQYHHFESTVGFKHSDKNYQLELLYMIAHVLYRNKKFASSIDYLHNMEALGVESTPLYQAKHSLLLAANEVFSNKLSSAINRLEYLLEDAPFTLGVEDRLNARFNLGVYYFLDKQPKQTIRCIHSLTHSDTWMSQKMGKEWVLRKNLSELLLQYDLGNLDLVQKGIELIQKNYQSLLSRADYTKANGFLSILRHILQHPNYLEDTAFVNRIAKILPATTFEEEDLQEVVFYAWLKAKILDKPFYPVLIGLSKSPLEEKSVQDQVVVTKG